jgi:DNA invertase Pin-like site-specific DNA recombinase
MMQPRRRPVAISDARSSSLRFPVWTLIAFKVIDDPSIDTTSRTGKLIMGILALIAEFENDIGAPAGRYQQGQGSGCVRFGPTILTIEVMQKVKELRTEGLTVPEIMRRTKLSKASIYRALAAAND